MMEETLEITNVEEAAAILGNFDENLRAIEKRADVLLFYRDGILRIQGEQKNVALAKKLIRILQKQIADGEEVKPIKIQALSAAETEVFLDTPEDCILVSSRGKPIRARTKKQALYIEKIRENIITLAIGPAGTGKTYLAVAMAVRAFKERKIERIILTRPAIEAGERLGFLPGDLQNKVDPYLRPLYDALFEFLGAQTFQRLTERGSIEVAPLAYMRGRTLENSFLILDEAQNTTREQMKMFLTRLGVGSKAVVAGDITQIDLPKPASSGLMEAAYVLKAVPDIAQIYFQQQDVVRHRIVQNIISAYEYHQKGGGKKR